MALVFNKILIICTLFAVSLSTCCCRVLIPSYLLAVSKGTKPRNRIAVEEGIEISTTFDEFGSLPEVQNVYQAISCSKQILVLRMPNASFVAIEMPTTSISSSQIAVGCNPIYPLGDSVYQSVRSVSIDVEEGKPSTASRTTFFPSLHLLLTGIAGDCRVVVRFLKQLVLNHSIDFGCQPTGSYVAEQLGLFLQSRAGGGGGGSRMLATHCYIISSKQKETTSIDSFVTGNSFAEVLQRQKQGTVFEVSAVGSVSEVLAGTTGGKVLHVSRKVLDERYKLNFTLEECKNLAYKVFRPLENDHKKVPFSNLESNGSENHQGDTEPPVRFRYLIIPDIM
jgi:20S proteasome alpha/beta subunit